LATVRAERVAVIGGVEDISVIELTCFLELLDQPLGYEEDIHVPLVVRGPGVPRGYHDTVSSYGIVDLSRTILEIAGANTDYNDDGVNCYSS
jgi:hypothetical protein